MLLDEKYADHTSMPSITKEQIYWAAMVNGIDDYTNPTDDMLAQIGKTLHKLRSVVGYYYDNETELSQSLASGDIVMACAREPTQSRRRSD